MEQLKSKSEPYEKATNEREKSKGSLAMLGLAGLGALALSQFINVVEPKPEPSWETEKKFSGRWDQVIDAVLTNHPGRVWYIFPSGKPGIKLVNPAVEFRSWDESDGHLEFAYTFESSDETYTTLMKRISEMTKLDTTAVCAYDGDESHPLFINNLSDWVCTSATEQGKCVIKIIVYLEKE